jgi:hypothetical protein
VPIEHAHNSSSNIVLYHMKDALATILSLLNEDLNRVKTKPYVQLPDSNSRSDYIVAKESWAAHESRERSIVTTLFTGQVSQTVPSLLRYMWNDCLCVCVMMFSSGRP